MASDYTVVIQLANGSRASSPSIAPTRPAMAAISATESSSSACASPEEVGAESPLVAGKDVTGVLCELELLIHNSTTPDASWFSIRSCYCALNFGGICTAALSGSSCTPKRDRMRPAKN
ncbi:hypothetical protein OPV22_017178 [Ensete ventricosum]|uniref:Uncharacterized protein n=1 Tax=Ensete ventricosum TaxID=4639 RepID=A0AAV8QWM2_ENSVE|nr:hypothetical protein OPV22_017178 [Ensete ventricosum]